jgi:hypothetical protein
MKMQGKGSFASKMNLSMETAPIWIRHVYILQIHLLYQVYLFIRY